MHLQVDHTKYPFTSKSKSPAECSAAAHEAHPWLSPEVPYCKVAQLSLKQRELLLVCIVKNHNVLAMKKALDTASRSNTQHLWTGLQLSRMKAVLDTYYTAHNSASAVAAEGWSPTYAECMHWSSLEHV